MKKQIVQALKSIGEFLGSVVAFYFLFCAIIIVFVQSFLKLNSDQYQILKNGLLFLLFFVIAIPVKLRTYPIKEKLQKALSSIPKFTKPQLISLGWLISKIVLWGITLYFFVAFLVFETFYPLLKDAYPDGYIDLGRDLELLVYLTIALIAFRLSVLHFYPHFSYNALIENIRKLIVKRKIPPFFAITSFVLLIFSVFIVVNFFFGNKQSKLSWKPEGYNDQMVQGTLTINRLSPDQAKISGILSVEALSVEDQEVFKGNQYFVLNFVRDVPVIHEEKRSYVYSEVDVEISGSDYYFPFNQYEVYLFFYPKIDDDKLSDGYNFTINTRLSSIVIESMGETPPLASGPYQFHIGYSVYFKLLVITIGIAFMGFFASVVMAKTRNQIIELAVGIFAALIAVRGFLVPENISSPILIDELFLLYIIALVIVLFIRINQLNWEK